MLHSASTPYHTRATSMVDQETRCLLLGREMVHHTLGRMPVQDFLDMFLPECPGHPDEAMLSCNNAFDAIPKPERNKDFRETSMYGKITEAFNAGSKRCPGISFFKGDGGGYAIKHSELPRRPSTKRAGFTISNPSLRQMFWQGKVLDFASDKGNDFLFEHITDPEQKNQAIADFGQMTVDAVQMLNTQFRDFAFSISMTPHTARLLRWDRSGVIVSRAINYRRNPRQLCLFLWRFGNATDAQRGIDVDIHKATGGQEALFKRLIKEDVILQENLAEDPEVVSDRLGRHYEAGKVFLVEVFDEGPDTMTEELSEPGKMTEDASDVFSTPPTPKRPATETARADMPQEAIRGHQFLVSRPVTLPRSLVSRSIKGYWAVDVQSSKVVFLKDCWRSTIPGVVKEGITLTLLREKGVTTGIPTVVCHGDVRSVNGIASSTATSSYIDSRWCQKYMAHAPNSCHISPRVHYRLVTGEVGYMLEESIAGTKELIMGCQSVFDILCTVERKAGIIHYDVSSSSIILVANSQSTSFGAREALLVDWELSAPEGRNDVRKWRRTASIAFSCSVSLPPVVGRPDELPHYNHLLVHDVESLVYVALYCGLLHLPWNYSHEASEHWLHGLFSFKAGKLWKMSYIRNTQAAYDIWNLVFADSAFDEWLRHAGGLVYQWYPPHRTLPDPRTLYNLFHHKVWIDPNRCRQDDRVYTKDISDVLESGTCPWTIGGAAGNGVISDPLPDEQMLEASHSTSRRTVSPSLESDPVITTDTQDGTRQSGSKGARDMDVEAEDDLSKKRMKLVQRGDS